MLRKLSGVAENVVCSLFQGAVIMAMAWSAHAAQPLSDQELNSRYLSADAVQPSPLLTLSSPQDTATSALTSLQFLQRQWALVDTGNVNNLLVWQDRQIAAVGAGLSIVDNSRAILQIQPSLNFGSEAYSLVWAGNLDQVVDIAALTGFAQYGIEVVNLQNIKGTVTIRTERF